MRFRTVAAAAGIIAGALIMIISLGVFFGHRNESLSRGYVPVEPVASSGVSASGQSPLAGTAGPGPAIPIRLVVPRLGVDASVIPVVVDAVSGSLGVPPDPKTVGWWAGGALPGASSGSAVMVGHVDSAAAGPGALFRLRRLVPGDLVIVQDGGEAGGIRYRITGLREYSKTALPATQIFDQSGVARLVVITCGGPFDIKTRHYRDNVVAYATRV